MKSICLNCGYSCLKYLNNFHKINFNNFINNEKNNFNFQKIFEVLKFFDGLIQNDFNLHVELIKDFNALGLNEREILFKNKNQKNGKEVIDYLNSEKNSKVRNYNFKDDDTLNFYVLMKIIIFSSLDTIAQFLKNAEMKNIAALNEKQISFNHSSDQLKSIPTKQKQPIISQK